MCDICIYLTRLLYMCAYYKLYICLIYVYVLYVYYTCVCIINICIYYILLLYMCEICIYYAHIVCVKVQAFFKKEQRHSYAQIYADGGRHKCVCV